MTPLELRAIAYAIVVAILVGGGAWLGAYHVQSKWDIATLAQDKAIQQQQADIIALTKQRDALQQQVGQAHEQIISNGISLTDGLTARLQSLEAAVRASALRPSVVNTGGVQTALASAGLDPELAKAIGRVNDAIASFSAACVKVDADRTSILSLEPKQ